VCTPLEERKKKGLQKRGTIIMEKTTTAGSSSYSDGGVGGTGDKNKHDDPIITTIDRNCAIFVRDVLFPLRRDWGSGRNHRQHSTIHPALYALDRLRTDLIEKRNTTSYSVIFPRGVLLVPKTSATTSSTIDSNNSNSNNTTNMEWNGQPNIVESTIEVIPNILSVKCVRCDAYNNNNNNKYTPSSANSKAFMRQITKPESIGGGLQQHELVVCSDRILQKDYYRQFGGRGNDESLLVEQQQRREDMPIQSTRAIEETLIREITKLKVNTDEENKNDDLTYPSLSSLSSNTSTSISASICDEYAKFELMAAKVSECMLLRNNNKEIRMGSALKPSSPFLFSTMLPIKIQHNFVNRCIQSVAIKYTTDAVNVYNSEHQESNKLNGVMNVVPKECVERAWKNINNNHSQ
ncbi:MAG: hypothetical protein ACI90V_001971, partial [Bacillariaceae sp.]|jgi:hypothetical protein